MRVVVSLPHTSVEVFQRLILSESKEVTDAWAVFDDSFKVIPKVGSESNVSDQLASWSTPPTVKRPLFDNYLDKG